MGASLGVFICAILDYLSVEFYYQIATVIITASNIFPGKLLVWLIVDYLCSMVVDWIVPYSVIDHLYLCQANSCNSSIESKGVSGHYFQRYFLLFFLYFFFFFSPLSIFFIEGVLGPKYYLAKLMGVPTTKG